MQGWAIVWRIWNWARWPVVLLIVGIVAFLAWETWLNFDKEKSGKEVRIEIIDFVPPANTHLTSRQEGETTIYYYAPN